MEKSFKRKSNIHIIIAILGLILLINIIRIQNYLWILDGPVLIVSIIAVLVGGWGILVPYIKIDEKQIKIFTSIIKIHNVGVGEIKEFYVNDKNQTIEIRTADKTYEIKLKNVKESERQQLKDEIEKASP
ncbi:MAG: hypothetical protein ACQESJ_00645 [Bacteroidota bacterium]